LHTKFWLGNLKGRELGRHRRKWKDAIIIELREIGWGGPNSSPSGQGPVVGSHEHVNERSVSIKAGNFWTE